MKAHPEGYSGLEIEAHGGIDLVIRVRKEEWEAFKVWEREQPWGRDHAGRPMLHPPAGDCYCKIPGDGNDRCPIRTTSAKTEE